MLDTFAVPVRERCAFPIGVGLWLPAAALVELQQTPEAGCRLGAALADRGLVCHTMNAFPHGDFHGQSVKDRVYRPTWAEQARLDYTLGCGELLAELLPADAVGSISTLPLGFKGHDHGAAFETAAQARLVELAVAWHRLRERTGRTIRLAIEPEPFCLVETTAEAIAFFERLWQAAAASGAEAIVREHVGLCYDVCHQAVEFEDASTAIARLTGAGIRIHKVQVSCAIELDHPADPGARAALARFVEPRYLHQTFARRPDGMILRLVDLTSEQCREPAADWLGAAAWRVHFHVPVDAERLGDLGTTRGELRRGLAAIMRLPEVPHLEVETYTWPVLPGAEATGIVAGLARELIATRDLLAASGGG
jgi:sugar phosphate isomerase/epimerase